MNGSVLLPQFTTAGLFTVSSANAFAVGPNGLTNPTFNVVTNVSSAATGLSITGNAAGAGVTLTALSSGSDESIILVAKGAGVINHSSSVQFNSLPIAFGFTDTKYDSEQSLALMKSGGGNVSISIIGSYTSGSTWSGLSIRSLAGGDAYIQGTGRINFASGAGELMLVGSGSGDMYLYNTNLLFKTSGASIETSDDAGASLLFRAYDDDGAVRNTLMRLVNGNTPYLLLEAGGGGQVQIKADQLASKADLGGTASMTTLTNATDTTLTNVLVVKGAAAGTTPNVGMLKVYVGTTAYGVPYFPLS